MVPWWHSVLVVIFGALAVALIIGGGLVMSFISIIRSGSISKGYQVAAISFVVGMANAGIAIALALQEGWAFPFFVASGLFMGGVCWLMSRLTK